MYKERRILAVVPARGGSKGIPLKNLRLVAGRSLIGWVGVVAEQVQLLDRVIVSTDHDDIAEEAEKSGISVPFRRPPELSGDRIGDIDVLQHALKSVEKIDDRLYDVVVMLQPTSPLRRAAHVEKAIRKLVDDGCDAVWSVSETDIKAHPLKQLVIKPNDVLRYYDPRGANIIARQELTPVYHRNGVVYALTREALLVENTLLPEKSAPLVIDERVVNIDTEEDLSLAERELDGRRSRIN